MNPIAAKIAFLTEADRLKNVIRANNVIDGSRQENSAEHSWHVALYALVFAPYAAPDVDVDRAIAMLLVHDIVEIDAGDHPIHLDHDQAAIELAERAAADRIFGLLPFPMAIEYRALWDEFESGTTATARFAKMIDTIHPVYQTLCSSNPDQTHIEIVRANVTSGRAEILRTHWPMVHDHIVGLLNKEPITAPTDFTLRLSFAVETCKLKHINRATLLCDGSRRENSGEHSWHIALYALTMAPIAHAPVSVGRVVRMLLLHDIVEIDAGDAPIHGDYDPAEMAAKEQAAADRLFGLLPRDQGAELRDLWTEFEDAKTTDAIYAKSVDRVQPLISNLVGDGGSWREYNVSYYQLVSRVGAKIQRGAPELWTEMDKRIRSHPWFVAEFD
ncbi:phosphohydrolase [Marivivens niveibacter]|uniref:5'-deoxynucleotidase n=1 Tax=Marivivens niveibacter TaxID=1930667 RepID=A0A251X2T7_9RHOB|nr:HD domain-containing protein [Marivivens niveibacter]OUD10922.1 phosphohydrolase [Marivivens niveibacter]